MTWLLSALKAGLAMAGPMVSLLAAKTAEERAAARVKVYDKVDAHMTEEEAKVDAKIAKQKSGS